MKHLLFVLLCSLFLPLFGCGEKLQGFSGSVTYGGKPLPAGIITFGPDAEHGNLMGAANVAAIKDGRYALPVNQGISGGWYRVSVESTEHVDGAEGGSEKHLIPPYSFSHEFKPDEKTFDIEIPAAAKK
ncbi:hypothetical protein FACS18942_02880 [Planctomycetales bacterium]|nr:hypothetical protein FACS18942_02880 [Planctomycetales bacterium]GHT35353.1 hypothetical protein FACS189427_04450 [Planctomycetales bacterium]